MYTFPIDSEKITKARDDIESVKDQLSINELLNQLAKNKARRHGVNNTKRLNSMMVAINSFVINVVNVKIQDIIIDASEIKSQENYYLPPKPSKNRISFFEEIFQNEHEDELRSLVRKIYPKEAAKREFCDFKYVCVKNAIWHSGHMKLTDFS